MNGMRFVPPLSAFQGTVVMGQTLANLLALTYGEETICSTQPIKPKSQQG